MGLMASLIVSTAAIAQVPVTDLYLFQMTRDDTSRWHIHSPSYLSAFNPDGYTNQPEFVSDTMLFVSVRKAGDKQNDIYALDLDALSVTRLTNTPENEFSPLLRPDGATFSCVRQAAGEEVDQQVFIYPLDRSDNGYSALPDLRTVGYHCWLDADAVALFLVGDPVQLALANALTNTHRIYLSDIGRCLRRTADGKLAYVHKYSDAYWYLKVLDPETRRSEILTATLPGQEDFAIGPDGTYVMGAGSKLYTFHPATDSTWREVFDLGVFGVQRITRLAVNDSWRVALVSAHE